MNAVGRPKDVLEGDARYEAFRKEALEAMGHPVLYYENIEGGHSNDSDPIMNAARWARHYVYLARALGLQ